MTRWIKLYGERNTNTNYLSKLIDLNLQVSQLPGVVPPKLVKLEARLGVKERIRDWYFAATFGRNLGWKHMRAKTAEELRHYRVVRNGAVSFVTITKNPYSWLLSLHRRPYSDQVPEGISFEDFLQMRWLTVGRGNLGRRVLGSPVELWNLKNASYLELSRDFPTVHLSTESILAKPAEVIDRIASTLEIPRKGETFVDHQRSTKDWSKDANYYRDYYLNERWREKLSPAAIELINARLDTSLLERLGYNLLTSTQPAVAAST